MLFFSIGILSATSVFAREGEMADEFVSLSGQSRLAMDLSEEELELQIVRCDRLSLQASDLQGSKKKVVGKKLRRLCGLFRYVLETKQVVSEDESSGVR